MDDYIMSMLKLSHKYIGILLAYFGFFLFFSGTLGYYKDEITLFMQPENYRLNYKSPNALKSGIDYLRKYHANADIWEITLPSEAFPFVGVSYKNDKKAHQKKKNKPRINIDPESGERVKARSTYGGNFIGKLHFNLWYIPASKGREIVGYATLLLILTIVTGVIIHKRIFKDFF
ncbi:PepSY-associated TM helix domain-containing protein [Campylobacter sputorum]|uniref:PepSY-associated TM helix domain-containing protein n=1 Tax=Campylobacter sputorum TaxID=206 RepID=UPI000B78B3D9|nr:PepSY-associated TM helix domain-containing protein [Campylobacter sputorum]